MTIAYHSPAAAARIIGWPGKSFLRACHAAGVGIYVDNGTKLVALSLEDIATVQGRGRLPRGNPAAGGQAKMAAKARWKKTKSQNAKVSPRGKSRRTRRK